MGSRILLASFEILEFVRIHLESHRPLGRPAVEVFDMSYGLTRYIHRFSTFPSMLEGQTLRFSQDSARRGCPRSYSNGFRQVLATTKSAV